MNALVSRAQLISRIERTTRVVDSWHEWNDEFVEILMHKLLEINIPASPPTESDHDEAWEP